jgi:citrate lyase subunit beta/citryl-CoA lyase
MLFVPGNRPDRAGKAVKSGTDAVILDLEDAVLPEAKAEARQLVADALKELGGSGVRMFVRVNAWRTGLLLDDVTAVVGPELDGIILAKTEEPGEIHALDKVISELEIARNLKLGDIEVVPLPESALGLHNLFDILKASNRIRRVPGVQFLSPGGDPQRSIGAAWSEDGRQMIGLDSKVVLDARAAGISHVISSLGPKLRDLEAIRITASRGRQAGADGAFVQHPMQLPVVHEVFGHSEEEINAARELLESFAAAAAKGVGIIDHGGSLVDITHARSAMKTLREASAAGMQVGDLPALDLLA